MFMLSRVELLILLPVFDHHLVEDTASISEILSLICVTNPATVSLKSKAEPFVRTRFRDIELIIAVFAISLISLS